MDALTIIRRLLAEDENQPLRGWAGISGTSPYHTFRGPDRQLWQIDIQRSGDNHHISSIRPVNSETHEHQQLDPKHGSIIAKRAMAALNGYIKHAVKSGDSVSFTPEAGDALESRRIEIGDQLMRHHGMHLDKPIKTRMRQWFGTTPRKYIKP